MTFTLQILGTSAAIQAHGRHQSAQVLKIYNQTFLIDCGEGTQEELKKRKVNTNKIEKIFISHLHGDHFLGLFGLISTMSLLGRKKRLEIYGPKGLKEVISTQLKVSESKLNYSVDLYENQAEKKAIIFENNHLQIETFPLNHRIACTGFLFKEKEKPRRINNTKLPDNVSISQIKQLKQGLSPTLQDGTILPNESCTILPKKSRSYAYCSDTTYLESTITHVDKVDLMYHETTFLSKHQDKANATYHSTSTDAAKIAKSASIGHLLMGHFSARYKDITDFVIEAQEIFPNSSVAIEGELISIPDEV